MNTNKQPKMTLFLAILLALMLALTALLLGKLLLDIHRNITTVSQRLQKLEVHSIEMASTDNTEQNNNNYHDILSYITILDERLKVLSEKAPLHNGEKDLEGSLHFELLQTQMDRIEHQQTALDKVLKDTPKISIATQSDEPNKQLTTLQKTVNDLSKQVSTLTSSGDLSAVRRTLNELASRPLPKIPATINLDDTTEQLDRVEQQLRTLRANQKNLLNIAKQQAHTTHPIINTAMNELNSKSGVQSKSLEDLDSHFQQVSQKLAVIDRALQKLQSGQKDVQKSQLQIQLKTAEENPRLAQLQTQNTQLIDTLAQLDQGIRAYQDASRLTQGVQTQKMDSLQKELDQFSTLARQIDTQAGTQREQQVTQLQQLQKSQKSLQERVDNNHQTQHQQVTTALNKVGQDLRAYHDASRLAQGLHTQKADNVQKTLQKLSTKTHQQHEITRLHRQQKDKQWAKLENAQNSLQTSVKNTAKILKTFSADTQKKLQTTTQKLTAMQKDKRIPEAQNKLQIALTNTTNILKTFSTDAQKKLQETHQQLTAIQQDHRVLDAIADDSKLLKNTDRQISLYTARFNHLQQEVANIHQALKDMDTQVKRVQQFYQDTRSYVNRAVDPKAYSYNVDAAHLPKVPSASNTAATP
jgi:chromosome segregation ATPase